MALEQKSEGLRERAHRLIPAGCHTYSKGDDQFPALAPALIARANGCRAFDVEGREYLDWGMGLRTVILGHGYPRVTAAVSAELENGSNFTRPCPLEGEFAEELVDLIPCAEMAKFAKNGSDVTTAATRLARAATGRDLIAFPKEQPFLSVDDWFIGATEMNAGVPEAVRRLSLTFSYGDATSLEHLFEQHPEAIAAVIMEAATTAPPPPGFLERVRDLTTKNGALLVFDETITGFRWDLRGAQSYFDVTPDLATFGKALANGFAVSALVGRRDLMELGGVRHDRERVFLLSTTHGGETHSLAAARTTVAELRERDVAPHLWKVGQQLCDGLNEAARDEQVGDAFSAGGFPCSPVLTFIGGSVVSDAELRTIFLQEMVRLGVLIPYVAPSFSHGAAEVDITVAAARAAFSVMRRVLDGEPIERYLVGAPVRPVFRRYNFDPGNA